MNAAGHQAFSHCSSPQWGQPEGNSRWRKGTGFSSLRCIRKEWFWCPQTPAPSGPEKKTKLITLRFLFLCLVIILWYLTTCFFFFSPQQKLPCIMPPPHLFGTVPQSYLWRASQAIVFSEVSKQNVTYNLDCEVFFSSVICFWWLMKEPRADFSWTLWRTGGWVPLVPICLLRESRWIWGRLSHLLLLGNDAKFDLALLNSFLEG